MIRLKLRTSLGLRLRLWKVVLSLSLGVRTGTKDSVLVERTRSLCVSMVSPASIYCADDAGEGPYEAAYRYTTAGHTSRHTLKSAQETGILHLNTEPGQHRYDFTELKDINYANNPIQLSVQHDVYSRPSASFIKSNSKPLCLDQELKSDARIRLEGQAPFTINLAVRKPASSRVESHKVTTNNKEWTLDLPLPVKEIGRYEISIVSMSDISDCEQIVHETDKLVTTVEVVESARIVPVSQTRDLCVGDNLDFLLQGKAPWTIE